METSTPTPTPLWKRFARHVRARLVSGFLLLVPIGLSIMVIQFLFNILGVFFKPAAALVPRDAPLELRRWMPQLLFVLLIYLAGLAVNLVIGKKILKLIDGLFLRIPGIKIVYAASKQLVETLNSANEKASFKSVVLIDCFFSDYRTIGFLTGKLTQPDGRVICKVFLPTAPNPTSGYLLLVPEEKVYYSTMDVETAFRIIVSGGMLSPNQIDYPPATR